MKPINLQSTSHFLMLSITSLLLITFSACAQNKQVQMRSLAESDKSQVMSNTVIYKNEESLLFETMDKKDSANAYKGSIMVPENRNNPESRMISLHYVRFPATGKKPGSPIIYLSGGPGGSGIQTAKYPNFRFPLFMALREFGDVIALDQRGTGASNITPKCVSSQILPQTQVLTDQGVTDYYTKAAHECMVFWKSKDVDVLGYTTVQNALDLDDLRKHFNAEKISLWGISYGSHLAFSALKLLKGKIDKVVIASAEGLNQTVKLPANTDTYFDRLQLAINQQPQAAKEYPDLKGLIKRVHSQLEKKPLDIKILQKDGGQLDFLFQRMHMQLLASGMISDPSRGVKPLLAIYKTLDQGHSEMLSKVLERGYFNDNRISFNVMSFAMDVGSGITEERLALVDQQAKTSLLGTALNFPMPHLNRSIEGLDLGDKFRSDPISDVPTLLLTGTLDGRTYISAQKKATKGLSNLTHVMVKNAGHNLFMLSPEVTETIKKFLKGEKIDKKEITVKLPQFVE
jgi:pimeloyl-ACP methyl ester carboxylesterase